MTLPQSRLIHTGLKPGAKRSEAVENRFNGFSCYFIKETVKTVSQRCERLFTGLKPGVNETDHLKQSLFRS